MVIKLGTHVTHDDKTNPIDFQGQKSRVLANVGEHKNTTSCVNLFKSLIKVILYSLQGGAAMVEWLRSWLAEQEVRGSIPPPRHLNFRDWLSPASKSRYG